MADPHVAPRTHCAMSSEGATTRSGTECSTRLLVTKIESECELTNSPGLPVLTSDVEPPAPRLLRAYLAVGTVALRPELL
jgi:hypothetical protein